MGLLGFGRIGICTARLAQAFGLPLLAHDRSPAKSHKQQAAEELGVAFVSLRDLFARSDIVAIQIPLDADHRQMVGRELLGLMKADAVLVNVGRGPLVDETALYEALRDGRLLGAACDVFAQEPPVHSPLLSLENFVGTPHVGAQTVEAQRKVGEDVARIIDAYAVGERKV
jgi:D-3-phosphoglycerate dehydrogenase / 2-oxoglutarate reductase